MSTNATIKIKWDEAESRKHSSLNTLSLRMISAILVLAITAFTLDISLPLGVAGGIPYIVLILAGIRLPKSQHVYLLATIATALTVLGFFISPPGGILWVALVNRGLSLFAIWITVLFVIERRNIENTILIDQKKSQKESEERSAALNHGEQRLNDFFEVGTDWYWESDENLCYTYLSASFEINTGETPEQFIGKNRSETQPDGVDDKVWDDFIKDLEAHREIHDFRHTRIRPDGVEIWISTTAFPLFDKTNKFIGYRGTATNVTELVAKTDQVQHTQQLLSDAVESIPEGFALFDKDDRLVVFNTIYKNILPEISEFIVPGVTFEEILRKGAKLNTFETKDSPEVYILERLRTFKNAPNSVEVPLTDGRWFRIEERKTRDGGTVGIRTDITQLKQTEMRLREREQQFKDYTEAASDFFWEQDDQYRFISIASNIDIRITDKKRMDACVGRTRWDVFAGHINDSLIWQQHIEDCAAHKKFRDFRYHFKDAEGNERVFNASGKPIYDQDGLFQGYRGTSTDVTDLVESQSKNESFVEALSLLSEGIALWDRDGKFVLANEFYRKLVTPAIDKLVPGILFEDWLWVCAKNGVSPESLGDEKAWVAKRLDHFQNPRGTHETLRGGRWQKISFKRLPDGSILQLNVDIHDLKISEQKLHQAQKMEAIGHLAGGVAHDFNNLMSVMLGNAEMLKDRVLSDVDAQHNLKAIIKAVDRAASLTQRLLSFSRQQNLMPQTVEINDLVIGLEDMLQRTMGMTVTLSTHLGSGTYTALIDPNQFENVLINLVINAVDAMPNGGLLNIETDEVTLDDAYAKQHTEVTPGDYINVSVSDTGTGMEADVIAQAFEPFFTTKEVGEGSGLGLSMVYGFIKQSNGHIVINSELDSGTSIDLFLPKSEEKSTKQINKIHPQTLVESSERILVIEDDNDVRKVSASILNKQGYDVTEANGAEDAFQLLNDSPPFDLLFTVVALPVGENGIEIAEKASQLQPGIKVLFTSGYAENSDAENVKLKPDAQLLTKPYRRAKLLSVIRTLLDNDSD